MSLTKTQWTAMQELIPAHNHKAALKLWNEMAKTVAQATRDQVTIERMKLSANRPAPTVEPKSQSSNCESSNSESRQTSNCSTSTATLKVAAQVEILELLVKEMQRTGKPYASALSEMPSTLRT